LSCERTFIASLREGYSNIIDFSEKLNDGHQKACSTEVKTSEKIRTRIGKTMKNTIDTYLKKCGKLNKLLERWCKSNSTVEHYTTKNLKLITDMNLAKSIKDDKIVKKLNLKISRNKLKLNYSFEDHVHSHEEIVSELTKFWDERGEFFDKTCREILFWKREFALDQVAVVEKSLQSLGFSLGEIDQAAKTVVNKQVSVQEGSTLIPSDSDAIGGDGLDDNAVNWADEPDDTYGENW